LDDAERPLEPRPVGRRAFLVGAGGACAALAGDMFGLEPRRVELTRHELPVAGLAAALDGIRVAQVTDLHLPANRAAAAHTLALLAKERPEIVVCTGDLLETGAALGDLAAFFARARGTLATVATLGNWEYRAGILPARAQRAYAETGVSLLVNAHRRVRLRGGELALVGLDDLLSGTPDPGPAIAGLPPDVPSLWLGHEPLLVEQVRRAAGSRPAAVLTGHTHGGQIRLPGVPPFTPAGSGRFVEGWYRDEAAPLYVSRGIGTVTVRARFLCPPELPLFTLRRG